MCPCGPARANTRESGELDELRATTGAQQGDNPEVRAFADKVERLGQRLFRDVVDVDIVGLVLGLGHFPKEGSADALRNCHE